METRYYVSYRTYIGNDIYVESVRYDVDVTNIADIEDVKVDINDVIVAFEQEGGFVTTRKNVLDVFRKIATIMQDVMDNDYGKEECNEKLWWVNNMAKANANALQKG